jgi:starch-binding outer membrane protein, SusD/RagB family
LGTVLFCRLRRPARYLPDHRSGSCYSAGERIEGIEAILTSVYNRYRVSSDTAGKSRSARMFWPTMPTSTRLHPAGVTRYAQNQQGSHITFWNTAYLTINEANYVIAGAVEETEGVTQEVRDRLRGEALFQRGFTYFDLARTYGYEPGREVGRMDTKCHYPNGTHP